jgi:hypothetical protein
MRHIGRIRRIMEGAMTDQTVQIALSIGVPTVAVLVGILINNSRLSDLNSRLGDLRAHIDARFDAVNQRFDDAKDTWRAELHRVEEVIDARLKHLEER